MKEFSIFRLPVPNQPGSGRNYSSFPGPYQHLGQHMSLDLLRSIPLNVIRRPIFLPNPELESRHLPNISLFLIDLKQFPGEPHPVHP